MSEPASSSAVEQAASGKPGFDVTFTVSGALTGARKTLPLAASVFAVGTVFGVLARQAGLPAAESLSMSALVFAGAAQFIALGLWTAPLPVLTIILTTLVVNLRHVLMGAAWRARYPDLSAPRVYSSAFVMVDESWAMTMREVEDPSGTSDAAFMLGSGLALFLAWISAAAIGQTLGGLVRDPAEWGLDFAFTAAVVALLVGMWKGKRDLVPWDVAAVVAVAASHWLPGKWYILLGALAGSVAGALTDAD